MDEKEFRGMLDLFPVVRTRDYCVNLLLQPPRPPKSQAAICGVELDWPILEHPAEELDSDHEFSYRLQEATKGNNDSFAAQDMFMQKLKMAAEKKIGATKAEFFCKAFEEAHEKLVYRELNLDAAKKFLSAYES
ncbi:unnamed protein product [Miscanthus lutarioriparius]|uniref:Uncharacterized protein n=1 Tax=Miscanthus lutarioriparius TaxID=422564 RepID=A0A811MW40_9POAL|nr:unnamed protein product [Miscanthus lutarioriparius]